MEWYHHTEQPLPQQSRYSNKTEYQCGFAAAQCFINNNPSDTLALKQWDYIQYRLFFVEKKTSEESYLIGMEDALKPRVRNIQRPN